MGVPLGATRHLWVSLSVSLSVSERFSERFSEHLYRPLSVSGRLFRRPERLRVSARLSHVYGRLCALNISLGTSLIVLGGR